MADRFSISPSHLFNLYTNLEASLKPPILYPFPVVIPTVYPHSPSGPPHGPRVNLFLATAVVLWLPLQMFTVHSDPDVILPELVMSALDCWLSSKYPHTPPISQAYYSIPPGRRPLLVLGFSQLTALAMVTCPLSYMSPCTIHSPHIPQTS